MEHSIHDSFNRQALMQTLGARLEEVSEGRVVISMPISPSVTQQHGVAHAGATFAIGDSASGYAALSLMQADSEVMTVEMKINLIAPAAGTRLIATGEVVKSGRRLSVTRCTVQTEDEGGKRKDVAILQGTMISL